ncbi:hypothetical protein BOTBODRAFT_238673 [Botryobasidium botryosum FD-172 SS1]|uniref:Uncharacterized protein n=1 Tax=Botryobasidium botryosum (strain FD-172 SS1) TaxID=930990 RepID=A0A067MLT1_BOTB1|nr:hypothetical protein BOTBODRAFT_238673 [Botryobasidium botryosum FD-172 SS1]
MSPAARTSAEHTLPYHSDIACRYRFWLSPGSDTHINHVIRGRLPHWPTRALFCYYISTVDLGIWGVDCGIAAPPLPPNCRAWALDVDSCRSPFVFGGTLRREGTPCAPRDLYSSSGSRRPPAYQNCSWYFSSARWQCIGDYGPFHYSIAQ